MMYEIVKAAHLVALFVWIGGMVAVALALRFPARAHLVPLKAYDRRVSTPAMILALLFGILLGVMGDWFSSTWLGLKILLVLGVAGLHGALVGKLRRAVTEGSDDRQVMSGSSLAIGLALLGAIVLLVTTKP